MNIKFRIVPNGLECGPERGFEYQIHDEQAGGQQDQAEVIGTCGRRDEGGKGDPVDPIVPPREAVPSEDNGPDQRSQGDLEHAKVKPGESNAEDADEETDKGGSKRPGHQADPCRE